jgi:hypothetical protein
MIEKVRTPSPRASRLSPSHASNLSAWYATSQVIPPKQGPYSPNKRPETVAKYSPIRERPDPARAMNEYRRNGDPKLDPPQELTEQGKERDFKLIDPGS